jgi:hypothetical protein
MPGRFSAQIRCHGATRALRNAARATRSERQARNRSITVLLVRGFEDCVREESLADSRRVEIA